MKAPFDSLTLQELEAVAQRLEEVRGRGLLLQLSHPATPTGVIQSGRRVSKSFIGEEGFRIASVEVRRQFDPAAKDASVEICLHMRCEFYPDITFDLTLNEAVGLFKEIKIAVAQAIAEAEDREYAQAHEEAVKKEQEALLPHKSPKWGSW